MGFDWSSLASSGLGAIGNVVGGLASNSLSAYKAQKLAEYQANLNYKFAKKSALNSPTWNRTGLENAGYNPMLALSNLTGAQSSWSGSPSFTGADFSGVGSTAVSNALAVKQQSNQDMLTNAQSQNYNADTVLKNSQSITELYTQLEKINHADLMQAQKQLTDKNVSWYDKQQAREDLRVANEIERTGNDFKVGMAQAIASQISSGAQVVSSNANAYDIYSNKASQAEQQREYNQWAKKHPYLKSIDQTLSRYLGAGVSAGAGYAAGKHAPTNKGLMKPLGFK